MYTTLATTYTFSTGSAGAASLVVVLADNLGRAWSQGALALCGHCASATCAVEVADETMGRRIKNDAHMLLLSHRGQGNLGFVTLSIAASSN